MTRPFGIDKGGIMKLNFVVFYGSVRSDRQGIKAARFVLKKLTERDHAVELIDAKEINLPLIDKMYKEYEPGTAPEALRRMAELIIQADGFVIVTGEYNHNIPPGLANLLDHFLEEYFYKPSGIVCYSAGRFGGVRAAVAIRPMLAELGMSSIPSVFPIPKVQDAFDEDGNALDPRYDEGIAKFLKELEWYTRALKAAREQDSKNAERSLCETARLVPSS
jgi:NAD(P)H-dependent FMN reductase